MAKKKRTMLEQLLADQARALHPPAPRRASGPRGTFQCCTCNEPSKSLAAAERHADEQRHHRFENVISEVPK